ncbi:MAG TPA: alkaline phosphatase family protein [Candidatus Binatia bacterium]|nr:alkaline phosphatase family protein [Candidatus Binatia bacterium]
MKRSRSPRPPVRAFSASALRILLAGLAASLLAACSDAGGNGSATSSNIRHLVVLVQENISFDAYLGTYCEAPTGSQPSCNDGPACCERGPAADPGTGISPLLLDDAEHGAYDPIHFSVCFVSEINGGRMDRFVAGATCGSDPRNFAYSDEATVGYYRDLARRYATADRWFQPIVGASSANDMYLARANFVFEDNSFVPADAIGSRCSLNKNTSSYTDPTIGDLLADAGVDWSFYIEGYQTMADYNSRDECPPPDPACPTNIPVYPCVYDPSDIPFQYYPRFRDNPTFMKDYSQFAADIDAGNLPPVTFVKAIGFRTEHPGYGLTISDGVAFTSTLVDRILSSRYADDTLILITYDEDGGYFDHVAPPPTSPVDGKQYGPRVPTFAVGRFARSNYVSHVEMEHSSIVKFIEWNWLHGATGQLGTRDAVVNNIGSLLDPAETGTAVPE